MRLQSLRISKIPPARIANLSANLKMNFNIPLIISTSCSTFSFFKIMVMPGGISPHTPTAMHQELLWQRKEPS